MTDEVTGRLDTALIDRRYVWVYGKSFTFMGFVLGLSDALVLMQRFNDFAENGFAIVRRSVILDVDCGDAALSFFEMMMRNEGLLNVVQQPYPISLVSMASAMSAIRAHGDLVLLEKGALEQPELELDVGELVAVDDLRTQLRFVSAAGVWNGVTTIRTPQIARVEFLSPYLKAIAKYAPRP